MIPRNDLAPIRHHPAAAPPVSLSSFNMSLPHNSPDGSYFHNLDPSSAAKQMAALNAAALARRSQSAGTSSASFGTSPIHDNPNLIPPIAVNYQSQQQLPHPLSTLGTNGQSVLPSTDQSARPSSMSSQLSYKQRQQSFLHGLATVMITRNTPLPPALTGVPYPLSYDPNSSPWKMLDCSPEVGSLRIAGKDVDLFRLWGIAIQYGGGAAMTQRNLWGEAARGLDLPDQLSQPQTNGNSSVALVLAQIYMHILSPFEEAYRKNARDQQQRAGARPPNLPQHPPGTGPPVTGRPQQPSVGSSSGFPTGSQMHGGTSGPTGPMGQSVGGTLGSQYPSQASTIPHAPQLAQGSNMGQQGATASSSPTLSGGISQTMSADSTTQEFGMDGEGRKRKSREADEEDGKRTRMKTSSEPPHTPSSHSDRKSQTLIGSVVPPDSLSTPRSGSSTSATARRPQPARRKIEYVPLAREVDTAGGRDLYMLEEDVGKAAQRRPLRSMDDWGNVDLEALTMSIRSRLATELSYALTTFAILSVMRSQAPGSGFPIHQCGDLLDETLDLLEEAAFDGLDDSVYEPFPMDGRIVTHRELVKTVYEEGTQPFAGLHRGQGSKDARLGPGSRPGDVVQAILNIVRNLTAVHDNQLFMAQHATLLPVLLRVCSLASTGTATSLRAAAPALSLSDLVIVRKDVLNILANIAGVTRFAHPGAPPDHNALRTCRRAFELVASFLVDPHESLGPTAWIMHSGVTPSNSVRPPLLPDIALEVFTRLSQPDVNRQILAIATANDWIWRLLESLIHRLPVIDLDFSLAMRSDIWLSYVEKTVMSIYSLAFMAPPELKKRMKGDRVLCFTKVMLRLVKRFTIHQSPEYRAFFTVSARRAIEALKLVDDGVDSFDMSQPSMPTLSFGVGYGEVGGKVAETGTGLLGGHQEEVTWGIMMQRELEDVTFSELESLARVG